MIKAREVDYNPQTGIVTAAGGELRETVTVHENAAGLDIVASDVSVRAGPELVVVESLSPEALQVEVAKDGETVEVYTARIPNTTGA